MNSPRRWIASLAGRWEAPVHQALGTFAGSGREMERTRHGRTTM